jgi:hypothetical protein
MINRRASEIETGRNPSSEMELRWFAEFGWLGSLLGSGGLGKLGGGSYVMAMMRVITLDDGTLLGSHSSFFVVVPALINIEFHSCIQDKC